MMIFQQEPSATDPSITPEMQRWIDYPYNADGSSLESEPTQVEHSKVVLSSDADRTITDPDQHRSNLMPQQKFHLPSLPIWSLIGNTPDPLLKFPPDQLLTKFTLNILRPYHQDISHSPLSRTANISSQNQPETPVRHSVTKDSMPKHPGIDEVTTTFTLLHVYNAVQSLSVKLDP
ncbi:hypothetical protein L1887_07740 [Cichorium endivia]|nr:hypothetical protein L1887_07740 [Cichorium endivia]